MRDVNTNVTYRGRWGILSHWSLITLYIGSSDSHRSYTSSSRSVSCYAAEFWVVSSLSSSSSCLQHVNCEKSGLTLQKLWPGKAIPVSVASQTPGERLAAFLPGQGHLHQGKKREKLPGLRQDF